MPIISVIIAVYNAQKYLRQCLDSVLNQTYKDIEVICVNDGSTDSSLKILEEYEKADVRVRVFTKENEGLGGASARNFGLEKATGKYVSILDSDDFFDSDMLKAAAEKAEKLETDIVVFGGCEFNNVTGITAERISILNRRVIPKQEVFSYRDCPKDIFQLTQGMAWNKLYKKEFIDKYQLRFQRIKYTDDAYFTFLAMALAKRVTVLDRNLCFYRINTGTNQSSGITDYPDSSYGPYLELKKELQRRGIYEEVEQSFLNCAITFMRHCYDRINRYDSFEYLHEKLKREVFETLQVKDKPKEFYYDERVYLWVRQIVEHTPGETAFSCARGYGVENTTAVLRFQFPFARVPKGSRVALIGAGIMGRHYYTQIMLNASCDVVCWVEAENPAGLSYIAGYSALDKKNYDYAVIAYANPMLIKKALDYLKDIGMDENRIIKDGGN